MFFRNGATAKWSRPTEASVDDHRVDKAVNDHFRQAGLSLIKQEQRVSSWHVGTRLFITVPTRFGSWPSSTRYLCIF